MPSSITPKTALTARLRFEGPDLAVIETAGGEARVAIADDMDGAIAALRRLNNMSLASGEPLRAYAAVDGFEPWWFNQETLFWNLMVPWTRHRRLLERLADLAVVEVDGAPEAFRALASHLAGTPGFPALRLAAAAPSSAHRAARLPLIAATLAAWARFVLSRPRALVYAIDKISPGLRHDFRLDALYRELNRRGVPFAEYIHTPDAETASRNWRLRRRPVVLFGLVENAWRRLRREPAPAISPVALPDDVDPLELAMLDATARRGQELAARSAGRYKLLKAMIGWQRPAYALVLDDSRYANELVAACKALGVPTVGYQHGLTLNRYFAGHACYGWGGARSHAPDAYGMWSPYFRARVLSFSELHTEEGTFVCGNLRPPGHDAAFDTSSAPAGPVRVLLISEPKARPDELRPVVAKLLEDPGVRVAIKLRPGEDLEPVRACLGKLFDQLEPLETATVYEAFARADVVAGMYSSVLYEALLAGKPVALISSSSPYALDDLAANGLAEPMTANDAVEAVWRAAATPAETLTWRRRTVWGETNAPGAQALVDAAEALATGGADGR